ncbi:MAG: DUF2905 domain-containing protein, partial [Epsilonproteobacteria bacterium]|nr:DUF2905 domain-containing protein [Campylobacterota bacterium]
MSEFGKTLIFIGSVIVIIGFLISLSDKLPFNFGRLPGDFLYKKDNFTFYFPLTSSILLSIFLSLILYIFSKFFR